MMRRQHYLRLVCIAILSLSVGLLILNVGISWIFIDTLTDPGCQTPTPIPNIIPPEEHFLHTEDGITLRAWYYPSQNGAAILSLGGVGGSFGDRLPPISPLIKEGYGVLQIDTRACAQPRSQVTLGANEVYDVQAGLIFLNSRSEVNPGRIGAYGFSMGAVSIIRAAAREADIAAIILEGGYTNLGDLLINRSVSKSLPEFIFRYTLAAVYWLQTGQNPWSISPIDDMSKIQDRPILFIYGENEFGNGREYEQYASNNDSISLWVVSGGDHGRNHLVSKQKYQHRVSKFFEGTIGYPAEN